MGYKYQIEYVYYMILLYSNHLNNWYYFKYTGHVFAFGESRSSAIANMILGLKEIQIRGEIRCNVDYTIDLLNVYYLFLSYFIFHCTLL